MTYDYPYDTVKTPKKEQHLSLLWNKLQNLEPKSSWKRLYIPLKVKWQSCLPWSSGWNATIFTTGIIEGKEMVESDGKNNRFDCHYSTITPYMYIYISIYMYHIVPIICVNSWLVSTDITFCAPNSLVTESQYLQHFLWSKKWER